MVLFLSFFLYVVLIEPYSLKGGGGGSQNPAAGRGMGRPQYEKLSHQREEGEHFGQEDCLAADMLILPTATTTTSRQHQDREGQGEGTQQQRPIPLLATNLDYDTEGYLPRLLAGWSDAPAHHKLVVAGGCDPLVLAQLYDLHHRHPDITIFRQGEVLGCAAGWNRILDYMLFHEDVPWAIIFNVDVYVPPGALARLNEEIWAEYDRDPRFCRGFFNVTAGQDAVVFVYTRHGLQTLGKFDENIYPAYFEDHDMDLRHNRTGGWCSSPPARFVSATMHHGGLDSVEYKSGTSVVRERMNLEGSKGDAGARRRGQDLTNRIERGYRSSKLYVSMKWGCDSEQENCLFLHPFNDPGKPLSYWRLDWGRRMCIHRVERRLRGCEYTLEKPVLAEGEEFPYPEALRQEKGGGGLMRRFFTP